MPFRQIFLTIAGMFGMACLPIHATPATPESAPVVAAAPTTDLPVTRIQKTLADYKRWLKLVEQRDAAAGLATAVVIGDKVVFEGTIGYADAASREPVVPTTVFRLASLSKAFATALTGLLVDDGRLSWDTRLINVLPYFKLKNMQAADQATIGDILGQKIDLPRNTYDNMLEDDVSYQELVRKLDQVDMTCGVGECYGYQNIAFSMIGDVVLARTGDFFYHQVDKRLFYPLGMATANYGREGLESSKSWARPHHASPRGWVPFEPNETYYGVAPAAGVNASLRDMEKWLIAQMGGRPDVLPTALLRTLHAPAIVTPSELRATPWRRARLTDAHYALGWRVYTYAGETLIYHAGAVAGYRTMIGFFPKYRIGMVTLWNSSGPTPSGLMPMVFDDLLGLPHVDWAQIEGSAKKPPAASRGNQRKAPAKRHR